jgi:hypothetical protein
MELAPAPAETATCANCSAPLVADQRYCLSCGQPCSPVRLAFLDVLEGDGQTGHAERPLATTHLAYAPLLEPTAGGPGWLRRYSPLFGALTVMLLAVIAGLLVGHWVTQRNVTAAAPAAQTIKIEGLGGAPLASAAASTPTTSTPASTSAGSSASSAKEETEETAKEEKAEKAQVQKAEKAPALKQSSGSLKKLSNTTGKKHEEEVNNLGAQPIETG